MKLSDIEDAETLATKKDLQEFKDAVVKQIHEEFMTMTRWAATILVGMALTIIGLTFAAIYALVPVFVKATLPGH